MTYDYEFDAHERDRYIYYVNEWQANFDAFLRHVAEDWAKDNSNG